MGENTFIALECILHSGKQSGKKERDSATMAPKIAAVATSATSAEKPEAKDKNLSVSMDIHEPGIAVSCGKPAPTADDMCWVHCEPYKYPPSCSEKFKNHVFHSAAQIATKKTVQPVDLEVPTAPAGVKKCVPLPRGVKSKTIKKDSGQNSSKQTNNIKKKNSATRVTTRQQSKRGKKKCVETVVGTITSGH